MVAMDPAAAMDLSRVVLFSPWSHVLDGAGLEAELAREVCEAHRLFQHLASLRAVARRCDRDDYLFASKDLVAVVHLTWRKESSPFWPSTTIYGSLDAWMTTEMLSDHHDHVGAGARHTSFALEFGCALALAALDARVRDELAPWAATSATRVRVEETTQAGRFTMRAAIDQGDVRYVEPPPDDRWYVATLAKLSAFMKRLDATAIDGCLFDDE